MMQFGAKHWLILKFLQSLYLVFMIDVRIVVLLYILFSFNKAVYICCKAFYKAAFSACITYSM